MGRRSTRARRERLSTEARWTVVAALLGVPLAVGVLVAAGVEQRTALLSGGGVLLAGLVAFVLLRAAGLLTTSSRP